MKKRVLSALLALCLTLSLAGAAFAENEPSGDSSSAASQAVSSVESEPQTQDETVSSGSVSGEDQTAAKTESTPAPTETPAASDVAEEEPESTPEPEAATEPDTTPAPTEDPVADVTENEESDGSVEYTAALETDGETMNVIVTAPEGAFAEGVQPKLSVTMLTAEDELNAVADKLKNAEVQYDGFTALDITFTDKATGEEVEPVKSVAVRIELPQAIVDSGIDLTTLAVQHLEEDENGNVQNVTEVATLDNGITLSEEAAAAANEAAGVAPMSNMPAEEATAGDAATETPAAVAEFDVDGFSSFVITWNGPEWKDAFEITFKYVDENGNEIDAPNVPQNNTYSGDQKDTRIDFSDYVRVIEGYTYKETRYQNWEDTGNENNGGIATYLTVTRTQNSGKLSTTYTYTLNVYNENDKLNTSSNAWTWGDFKWPDTKKRKIYLIYTKDETTTPGGEGGDQGGTTVTNATVTTTKTADLKDDGSGNYDLTLSISGDRGNKTKKQAVDVLFVLDLSNSMATKWGNYSTRLEAAREAIAQIVGYGDYNGLSDNENLSVKYSLVGFGGGDSTGQDPKQDAGVEQTWTDSASTLYNEVPKEIYYNPYGYSSNYYGGGTNYEAGIVTAKELLKDPGHRTGAQTVVIFITDGNPGFYYNDDGATAGDGQPNDYNRKALQHAVDELKTINTNYFYLVGVTNSISGKVFLAMENAVAVPAENKDSVTADSPQALIDAFKNIQQQITFFAANDVTITDPLSDYADIVLNANGDAEFTITVTRTELKDDKGKVTSEAKIWTETVKADESLTFTDREEKDVTVTPAYDEITKTITLTFPHSEGETLGYELEPGYTYSISTVITPSETAKKLGMNNVAAQQTPDDNTGTHSVKDKDGNKQQGFWSNDNDNAKVTFTANGEPGAQAFPKPVIQVTQLDTGNLTISKQVGGDATATDVANQTFSFTITAGSDVNTSQLKEGEFTVTGGVQQTVSFKEDQNGAYSALLQISGTGNATIVDLPVGTYTVTETQPTNLQNFTFDTTTDLTDSGTVSKDVNSTVTITNKYHRLKYELTVSKIVGGGMGDTENEFDFTVTLTDTLRNNGAYSFPTGQIPKDLNAIPEQDGVYSFQLSNGDRVVIPLPAGVTAVVAEDTTEHPDYTVTSRKYVTPEIGDEITETTYPFNGGDKQTVENINGNYTVDFKNVRPTVAPTGLEDNHTKPFGLMVGVAVMAGLALAGGAVVRRRRRWME